MSFALAANGIFISVNANSYPSQVKPPAPPDACPFFYLFLVCLYVKRFRVLRIAISTSRPTWTLINTYGENSPSLCPTMSSVILTSW